MFTQSAFIRKNTPELRKKLEELGYKQYFLYLQGDEFIDTFHHEFYGWVYSSYTENLVLNNYLHNRIDCGTNEDLFLALAALRDDSDYMQWFIWKEYDKFKQCLYDKYVKSHWDDNQIGTNYRKATSAELIEHFKTE